MKLINKIDILKYYQIQELMNPIAHITFTQSRKFITNNIEAIDIKF